LNESRDVERIYSIAEAAAKLRRLADALESGKPFRIQVAGERIYVPVRAEFSVEHERGGETEEVEFQMKWTSGPDQDSDDEKEQLV
jgi:amphi-Trp domain-containing protein